MIHSRAMAVAAPYQLLTAGHRVEAVFGSRSGTGQSAGGEPTAVPSRHPGPRRPRGISATAKRIEVLRYLLGKVRKNLQKLADTGCNPALVIRSLCNERVFFGWTEAGQSFSGHD
ncbi:hypothetical protein LZ31DRAFT_205627 [Colletotrichum somersetense]|nr:hypothetical protein LZ31DRAFT_205627 [Colletotrichum somersetense]